MKKCSICEKEVEDNIIICPYCGHDFDFVPTRKCITPKYESINEQLEQERNEKRNKYKKIGTDTLKISNIKKRTDEQEKETYKIEIQNRESCLKWWLFVIISVAFANMILTRHIRFAPLLNRVSICSIAFCTAILIFGYFYNRQKISKIVQDIEYIIVMLAFAIQMIIFDIWSDFDMQGYFVSTTYKRLIILSILCGIVVSSIYIKTVHKVYPLYLFVPKVIAPVAIVMFTFKSILKNFEWNNMVVYILAGGILSIIGIFIVVLFFDIKIKARKVCKE